MLCSNAIQYFTSLGNVKSFDPTIFVKIFRYFIWAIFTKKVGSDGFSSMFLKRMNFVCEWPKRILIQRFSIFLLKNIEKVWNSLLLHKNRGKNHCIRVLFGASTWLNFVYFDPTPTLTIIRLCYEMANPLDCPRCLWITPFFACVI